GASGGREQPSDPRLSCRDFRSRWWRLGVVVRRKRIIPKVLLETGPFAQPHAEEMLAVLLAHLVNGHDVRVIQVRRSLRLGAKALDQRIGRQRSADNRLQRHQAIQTDLSRLEDDAHSAASNLVEQFVLAESATVTIGISGPVSSS